jgi:hypothetical protein
MAHNTLGVLAGRSELDFAELQGPLYAVAAAGCGLAAWVLWRSPPRPEASTRRAASDAPPRADPPPASTPS